jgi:hypothetical protein
MIRHGSGETMATLTTAATLQREATDQHLVFAWGQALFNGPSSTPRSDWPTKISWRRKCTCSKTPVSA